ncbi:MAG: peptide chain release factor N(5)-glutamine methyltransferase [Bacteroidota bacterium]|nr:peptide chain release factor N(5)-glutamine methyltransferase [Bacteroidota bacterium]
MITEPKEIEKIREIFLAELGDQYTPGEIRQIFFLLCEKWMGWTQIQLQMNLKTLTDKENVEKFNNALKQLKESVPIQYITGTSSFLDLDLKVTPATLIPRPETEELIQYILKENEFRRFEDLTILDIGTGTGCIAISLARFFRGAKIWATDCSREALAIAEENAARYQADIRFVHQNILDESQWNDFPAFDIMVSNPPYVTEEEKRLMKKNVMDHEPSLAIFIPGDDPLLFYKAIVNFALKHLNRPGSLYIEINEQFGTQINQLLHANEFNPAGIIKDLNGKDRFASGELKFRPLDTSYWHVPH